MGTQTRFLRRALLIVPAAALLVPVLSGELTANGSTSRAKPVHGGTLTVAIDAQPTGFDPVTADLPTPGAASVFNEIFASLTAPTAKGTYAPYLAQAVKHNKNDTRWVITLRPGAEFSDGTPINASAVVYNLDRLKASGEAFGEVNKFQVGGDLTVVATMKRPWSAFPAALSGQTGAIASPTAVKAEGKGFATKPVGSGPYELSSWSQGNQIVLVRNPHFWRPGLPYLNQVVYKIITDASSRLSALQAGGVDVAQVDPPQAIAAGINSNNQYQWSYYDSGVDLVYFNTGVAPLNSIVVRQALAMATDRSALVKSVWRGVGQVANSPAWPNDPYFANVKQPSYNPTEAKKLIKTYETRTGKQVKFSLLSTNDPTQELEAQALQSMWDAVGAKVTLAAPQEAGTQSLNVVYKKYEAATFGFPPFLDPDQWWSLIWSPGGFLNVDNYKNSTIKTALARAGELVKLSQRKAEYTVVQEQLAKKVYALFLHYNNQEAAVRSNVHGLGEMTFPDGKAMPYGQEFGVPFSVESLWLAK